MRPNNDIASIKENANIDNENNSPFNVGFLDVPFINAANTIPAPNPPPIKLIVANPAPINFAAPNILFSLFPLFSSPLLFFSFLLSFLPFRGFIFSF